MLFYPHLDANMKSRTTVTLDSELVQLIREESVATRRRFGDVLNERLRSSYTIKDAARKKFVVKPLPTGGFAPGVDANKLNQLFDSLEAEKFFE
jgi:hypothetical protein